MIPLMIVAPSFSFLAAGVSVHLAAHAYRPVFDRMLGGKPLPILTETFLKTAETISPSLLGLIFGLLTVIVSAALAGFAPDENTALRRTVWCTTAAWMLIALSTCTALLALVSPLL